MQKKAFSIDEITYLVLLPTYISLKKTMYEGWNFNSGNYLFTTDTK